MAPPSSDATLNDQTSVTPNTGASQTNGQAQQVVYHIERKIGKGQFSTVYRAKRSDDGTIVALKRVPLGDMVDEKARADCIKEIDLLKSLDHPNVVRHYESFLESRELVIVLELADAGDLGKMIKHFRAQNRLIPERTVWKYFVQVAGGLAHMHDRRVMHRDIKPANVFITAQGVAKLGDLGLGRFFSQNTVEAHSLVGTPYYMSPERMEEKGYSFKSDIWSLGCLLYEMCALHSPFYGDKMTLYSLCRKIEVCDYPELPADIYSQELRSLIASMIQSDPASRPDAEFVYQYARRMYERCAAQRPSSGSSKDAEGKPINRPGSGSVHAAMVGEGPEGARARLPDGAQ
ncbi:kinase-like protein [Gonapodya prolifera JEL478]|uniref:NEK6-subfamily protein kinase n=1 Tax=Gonapodya prolifera (strain JEL478) TaxID=1344416 RepID=A0A139AIW6_GONPJ|nr:kinase-like protein [Gonapodya prolifera JEL478]|eukprot:KXS16504.1 kinase-like protein [Gonapodya prolifera JEL478]